MSFYDDLDVNKLLESSLKLQKRFLLVHILLCDLPKDGAYRQLLAPKVLPIGSNLNLFINMCQLLRKVGRRVLCSVVTESDFSNNASVKFGKVTSHGTAKLGRH